MSYNLYVVHIFLLINEPNSSVSVLQVNDD